MYACSCEGTDKLVKRKTLSFEVNLFGSVFLIYSCVRSYSDTMISSSAMAAFLPLS